MMKKKYMLDIETLGVNGCPVLIQIGCVDFALTEELDLRLDINKQPESATEPSTVKFWSDKVMPSGDMELAEAFSKLTDFLKNAGEVWSHNFDYNVLFSIASKYGFKIPYHYMNFRDIRTLMALSSIDLRNYNWAKKTHNAVDDCKFQVGYCKDAFYKIIQNKNE